ncbi:MAG: 50S ribosomal protein L3 [Desulfurococcales archaeon]|jgi:large subunit ribosomal protein L3|nr:50S ribosomal protein L3 [Desulfurococcales archaeon]
MGHRKKSAPRRGSLGVRPRKRAEGLLASVRNWPKVVEESVRPIGFLGYKVGMTHAMVVDDRKTSLTFGKLIFMPITVLETPPMILAGIRAYEFDANEGKQPYTEAWAPESALSSTNIGRLIRRFNGSKESPSKSLEEIESSLGNIVELRALMLSQPALAGGISKKKPELFEVALTGTDLKKQFEYSVSNLGKQLSIGEIFKAGNFVDVLGITKGKGFQGPIKRFGVKVLPRWHKHRKAARKIGARGPGFGSVSTAPQAGQMGFHQRVDYNKRILMIGEVNKQGDELLKKINPPSGWHKYGLIKSDFVLLAGSVPGARKRPLVLRHPIRPIPFIPEGAPKITYIHGIGEL